jgi:hypothetical protein
VPQCLTTLLPAVGVVLLAVFLAGPVLAVRRRRDRGGRSASAAAAVRCAAAAARVHPAGVAVPSAVLAAGIVLFTFVESATIRAAPPGGSGPGSVPAARVSQPYPDHQPRQPALPVQPALPGSACRSGRSLTGRLEPIASPLPVPAAVFPAAPGRVPQASPNPSSHLPDGSLAGDQNSCLAGGYGRGRERGVGQ